MVMLLSAAAYVCSVLTAAPEPAYETRFAAAFQAQISRAELVTAMGEVVREFGPCLTAVEPKKGNEARLTMAGGDVLAMTLVVDGDGLIETLAWRLAEDHGHPVDSWDDVGRSLGRLSGKASAAVVSFTDPAASRSIGGDQPLAVGSTFKLYVLGALREAVRKFKLGWQTSLPLRDDWKSLPGGILQDLPVTYAPSVYEYAQKMISISDNTATDHLMHALGRDAVEAMVPAMGTAPHPGNDPFLMTVELFKLKWAIDPARTQAYADASPAGRRAVLDTIATIPRTDVCLGGVRCTVPTAIDTIEWFASNQETCQAIHHLYADGDPHLREILSAHVPVLDTSPGSVWSYAGYKGGSEPGVLSVTYLLKSRSGHVGCASVTWNDPDHDLPPLKFIGVVAQTLAAAEAVLK